MLDPNGSTNGSENAIKCERYVYDTSKYQSSAVKEWDLVCDRSWMKATAQFVFEGGVFCGATILGILSDKIGRKTTLCGAIMVQMTVGVLTGIIPAEFYSFIVLRFIVGCTSAAKATVFILGVELLGPKDRLIPGIVFNLASSIGYFLFGLYAYLIEDWTWLNAALSITALILIPYWWVLPESDRWLIVKGKFKQAKRNVLEAAKMNSMDVDPITVDQILRETQKSANTDSEIKHEDQTFRDVLLHPRLWFITLNLSFIWFISNSVYWGLSFNVSNLGGNLLLNFLISGAVEFPGYASIFLFDKYMGRRLSLAGCYLITGSTLFATTVVPADMDWLKITFAMIGKMAITAVKGIVYIYTTELYPTIVRSAGMGVVSTAAKIGGMTAPYVLLLADTWKPLPMFIYGCLAVIGGLLGLLLRETKGEPFPETLEDLDSKKK